MTKTTAPRDSEEAFWNDAKPPMIPEEPGDKRVYDLEERRARFGSGHRFCESTSAKLGNKSYHESTRRCSDKPRCQLREADDAMSKKEFLKSIGTSKKETREVKHFLQMAVRAVPDLKAEARKIWVEARELHLIFSKIWRSGRMNDETPTFVTRRMRFVIRASSFLRPSSFVIRHSDHAH